MSSLAPNSLNFVEADSEMRKGNTGVRADFCREGSKSRLHLSRERVNWRFRREDEDRWQVWFNRNILLTVDLKSALGNTDLDLSQLQITELQMDVDFGNYKVKMASSVGTLYAYIEADLSNLEVIIPKGQPSSLRQILTREPLR